MTDEYDYPTLPLKEDKLGEPLDDEEYYSMTCSDCGMKIMRGDFRELKSDNTVWCYKCWRDRGEDVK